MVRERRYIPKQHLPRCVGACACVCARAYIYIYTQDIVVANGERANLFAKN